MAKSQYTDNITGEIFLDVRVINNKAVDLSPLLNTSHTRITSSSFVSETKYSSKSIQSAKNIGYAFFKDYSSFNNQKFTLSFWTYPKYLIPSSSSNQFIDGSNYFCMLNDNINNQSLIYYVDTITNEQWRFSVSDFRNQNPYSHVWLAPRSSSRISINTWHHYALTFDGSYYRYYIDGVQFSQYAPSNNYLKKLSSIHFTIGKIDDIGYWDDMVFINNQVLWTSNFEVPNTFLTGSYDNKRISNKYRLDISSYIGDYFDKAFLY